MISYLHTLGWWERGQLIGIYSNLMECVLGIGHSDLWKFDPISTTAPPPFSTRAEDSTRNWVAGESRQAAGSA